MEPSRETPSKGDLEMVAISLTHDSAKEMANRLRQFLAAGGISIKQTHAYEALAKSLGYRDWNTLLGALQASGSTSQDVAVGATASSQSSTRPATLLLIDRHAMAAHGVTVAQIESAFRREFPDLLAKRTEWETLCYEQLPPRELPPFRPPVISMTVLAPEKAHVHHALMDCMEAVAKPKWMFSEEGQGGTMKFTLMFYPECDAEKLLPALREALARLPAEIRLSDIATIDPDSDHRGYGTWRTDGVSYYVWAWESDTRMMVHDFQQLASMALKFNGDALVRLRDVATLQVGIPRAAQRDR
jgi:multidrug efflux pump subunit AcrB